MRIMRVCWGYIGIMGVILGLYRENGGNTGIMENNMETTI